MAWRLDEDLRLGKASAETDPEQFGDVVSLATDSQGRIYVVDQQSQDVRVFQASGAFSHRIGGRGEGPGEFTFVSSVSIARGDTLVARDDGTMRYSVYAPDGSLVRSRRRDIVGTGPYTPAATSEGGYIDWALIAPDGRFGPRLYVTPVRYDLAFEQADTFPAMKHTWEMLPGGMPQVYYSGRLVVTGDRAGIIWFAHSDEYRIYRRTLDGDTTLVSSLQTSMAPIDDEAREELSEDLGHQPDFLGEVLEALPEHRPVILEMSPDNAGHVFVFPDVRGIQPERLSTCSARTGCIRAE